MENPALALIDEDRHVGVPLANAEFINAEILEFGTVKDRLEIRRNPHAEVEDGFEALEKIGGNAHFFSCSRLRENAVHRNVYSQDNSLSLAVDCRSVSSEYVTESN